jgi:hypothetical protein
VIETSLTVPVDSAPAESTFARTVVPAAPSWTKASHRPFVSLGTRLSASL